MSTKDENVDTNPDQVDSIDTPAAPETPATDVPTVEVDVEPKEPNLIFVGKRETRKFDEDGKPIVVAMNPPKKVRDGRATFEMPQPEDQLKPFYHLEAARIARAFPKLYKRFVEKGEK